MRSAMNGNSWRFHAAWIAIVVAGTSLYIAASHRPESDVRKDSAGASLPPSAVVSVPVAPLPAEERVPPERPQTPTQESLPALSDTERVLQLAKMQAADYVASFHPGVYIDDPVPLFVKTIHEVLNTEDKTLGEYADHLQSSSDEWSSEMEARLRSFFESQPETNTARVGVSCRSTQCKILVVTLYRDGDTQGRRPLTADFSVRIMREPWYRENFVRPGGGGGGASNGVSYQVMTLERRTDTPKLATQ